MAVYVDESVLPYGRMMMCHMAADTLEELYEMADKIGVARRYIQRSNSGIVHFDICKSKRALAVQFGAVEITGTELVKRFSPILKKA